MDPKQTLVSLIDAYADAKKSGNETLVRLAASPLQDFFNTYDVVPVAAEPPAETDE